MKFLLDTHAALWWWEDSPELSDLARRSLSDPASEIHFSAVSGYELFQKVRIGKLSLPMPLMNDLPAEVRREGWHILPLGLHESLAAARFDTPHRDPFDRLLAAQSAANGLTILTADPFFREAGFPTLW